MGFLFINFAFPFEKAWFIYVKRGGAEVVAQG
jgi:hypothetical protein